MIFKYGSSHETLVMIYFENGSLREMHGSFCCNSTRVPLLQVYTMCI